MDYQRVVDGMSTMACIVSVESLPDGGRGKYRIVAGNKAYIDSIEHPAPGTVMLSNTFVPNSEYTDYITRDLNFEDYCYRAAVGKKCLHSYAHPDRMDVWFNMTFLPVGEDEGNLSYCMYLMEINLEAKSENLAQISSDVAASVVDTCIRLRGTNDFRSTMKDVAVGILELCGSEHCCILVLDELERTCSVLCEAFAKGSKLLPMDTYLDDDFYDIADSWKDTIAGSDCLIVKDEHDMKVVKERNPVWHESLVGAGAHNIILFPLKSRNQLLGYMWVINYDQERSVKIKETLEVTTFILGSELGNYLLLDRLRLIGSKDMLTGVMNRNEMNNYVDDLARGSKSETSVGVIFADLNGLKTVNDVNGHNAGDLLLKNAANALGAVFKEEEIFRAGGDEFSIIVTGVTKKDIEERIERIRKESLKYNELSFALGGAVEKNSSNVRMALRKADERMYEDKKKYYEEYPDRTAPDRHERSATKRSGSDTHEQDMFNEINYDTLTGLPNMSYFFKLAENGRKRMHDENKESALVFLNMSGLRLYNIKYGFAEGDMLIKDFGRIITKQFSEENTSRFGQDHFAVFSEMTDLEKKLKRIIRETKTANGGRTLPVRIGIYPDSMGMVETAIACDRAKYACDARKKDNQSFFAYYDQEMLKREINTQYVVDNLDRAISEGWITAFYQPIVRATSRKVSDEEALARWIDPVKGMMSPAEFIPVLEDTKLIYKVDLHILEIIIERIKRRQKKGERVVPVSVNLSRTDFEVCDIVEEINNRVESAGISKDLITIEITESVIGENFEYMKEQIERFRNLGFAVWMDDFGSGYSSLDVLRELKLDLIKFDMMFMRQFETSPKSRIILTELMRMAVSLNTETVTEGVETKEQVEFLSEIGCTKMQGYYFCKPLSDKELEERIKKGNQIGFENPEEEEYHKAVSSISLYDLGAVSSEEGESIKHYFDTIPMAVVETDGNEVSVLRCNKSCREFMTKYPEITSALDNEAKKCENVGQRAFFNGMTDKGEEVNAIVRRIVDNPVKGVGALAIAILDISEPDEQTLTYSGVAKALSADYIDLYQVDLNTEKFTQYSPNREDGDMSVARHGEDFFATSASDAVKYLYKDDHEMFLKSFTKENVVKSLDENGTFTLTYRLVTGDDTQYVNMKAVRMGKDGHSMILGINNVDAQMRAQEALERLQQENTTYQRISALIGDFIAIYTVDPNTNTYMQYSASEQFAQMGTSRFGTDFFEDSRREVQTLLFPEDRDMFMSEFTREKILGRTMNGGVFQLRYRLLFDKKPVRLTCRAGIVNEKDGPQLIVGISVSNQQDML